MEERVAASRPTPVGRRRRRGRTSPHPTAQRLLDSAVELLGEMPFDTVSLALVLERTGISHGSVYHHFEDFTDLLGQAIAIRFGQGIEESIQAVRAVYERATDAADYRAQVLALLAAVHEVGRSPRRSERAQYIAAIESRPDLRRLIALKQQALTDDLAATVADAQRRGWLRADISPQVIATLVQALTLGRLVDDVTADPLDPGDWSAVVIRSLIPVLFDD